MKEKALVCLAIMLSIALALMPAGVMASPASMEVVFQDTGTNKYIIEDCTPPVTFKVDLVIHGVTNMWGWSTVVSWNPAVLNCTKKQLGPFNPAGTSLLGFIDNENGRIPKLAASTVEEETITGDGVVCTLTFLAHHTGSSIINITDTNYINYPDLVKEYIDEVDGQFECRAYVGPPRPPAADFTPPTCTQFFLDKENFTVTVQFDAGASEGSYDSLPDPGTENPIIEYRWDFDNDGEPDYISTNFVVALSIENIENYLTCDYFLGWSCRVEWDPNQLVFIGYEKGPFPDVEGVTLDTESPAGVIQTLAFGALEEVNSSDVTGSGVLVYLYFSAQTYEGVGCTVTITESKIASFYYDIWGHPVICKEEYTPQFAASYQFITPECTASWTYDETYPGTAITAPVTLWVYAPDCDPTETHSDFVDRDSVTNSIHILPPVMGPDIDVYTEKGGTGKGCDKTTGVEYPPRGEPPFQTWTAMSDAFGPQEEVTVYAKVTYNDEPVENKLVTFEIRDSNGNVVAWRENSTNSVGIATVSFRIPWTGATAEEIFGAWLITATVEISEETVIDTCRFRYGYIVSIVELELNPASLHKGEELGITVTLANIAFTSKDVVITYVLYDECGVPINHFGTSVTVNPVGMVLPTATITIPYWAFVGTGKVYINIFDDWPATGGTSMCPEDSEGFVILNTQ